MVHAISRVVIVAPRQKATNKMWLSINNSTGAIAIVTIAIRIKIPDNVGKTMN